MRVDLAGKVSLVTGAARGIGQAIADRLAASGSRVIYSDLDEAAAKTAAEKVAGATGLAMDVTRPEQVRAVVRQVEAECGRLDIVVNNAGVNTLSHRVPIDEFPRELVEEIPSTAVSPYQSSFARFRASPYGRGARKAREESVAYAYEDEDQSVPEGLRPGIRVRHPKFGEGTVISIEPLDDDTKLVVRFNSVGQKTLRAKFAKLEVA